MLPQSETVPGSPDHQQDFSSPSPEQDASIIATTNEISLPTIVVVDSSKAPEEQKKTQVTLYKPTTSHVVKAKKTSPKKKFAQKSLKVIRRLDSTKTKIASVTAIAAPVALANPNSSLNGRKGLFGNHGPPLTGSGSNKEGLIGAKKAANKAGVQKFGSGSTNFNGGYKGPQVHGGKFAFITRVKGIIAFFSLSRAFFITSNLFIESFYKSSHES